VNLIGLNRGAIGNFSEKFSRLPVITRDLFSSVGACTIAVPQQSLSASNPAVPLSG
jgi:hypothetical protein